MDYLPYKRALNEYELGRRERVQRVKRIKGEKKQEAEQSKPINESKTKSISEEVRCCKLKLSLVANTCS